MKRFISDAFKKYPLSPFLITLFVCLHGITYFYEWIKLVYIIDFFGYFFLCVIGAFFIALLFFKSLVRSALLISIFCLIYFYFGFFQDAVTAISVELGRNRYVLSFIFVAIIFLCWWLKRSDIARLTRLNYFLNILFAVLIIVDGSLLTRNVFTKKKKQLSFIEEQEQQSNSVDSASVKPDIYFLVFDEYASSLSLKENFGYDNSNLDSFLVKNGFYVAEHSISNYASTPFSVSSTLNMNYYNDLSGTKYPEDFPAACESMYNNKWFSILEDEGYEIYNYSLFDFKRMPSFKKFVAKTSLKIIIGKSMKELTTTVWEMFFGKKDQYKRITKTLGGIDEIIQDTNGKPKFMYIHLLLPHGPYIFNSDGTTRSPLEYSKSTDVYVVQNYLNQLTYTNEVIKMLINKIMTSDRPKLVVLEGDHGYRFLKKADPVRYEEYFSGGNYFKNLCAYYFFDKNYTHLYDSISPVNTFRVVSNQYFNKNYPLLKDSSIWIGSAIE